MLHLSLLTALAIVGLILLLRSSALSVQQIRVQGAPAVQVLAGSGLRRGEGMLGVDTVRTARRMEDLHPAYRQVRVRLEWPWTVAVSVVLRPVIALVATPRGGLLGLSPGGMVLPQPASAAGKSPYLLGRRPLSLTPDQRTADPQVHAALRILRGMPSGLRDEISEVWLPAQGVPSLITLQGTVVLLGTESNLSAKWAALAAIWPVMMGQGGKPPLSVNLSDPARPSVHNAP